MNTASRFAVAASALLISIAAFAQSPKQRDAENLARFERYASAPHDSMHYFRIDRFQYLGPSANGSDVVAVWTGVNQVYLLTLESPCIKLEYANAIALTSTSGNVNARMDFVKYDRGRQCRIETIRNVDYKAVRAEMKRAQTEGGT